jgi:hypothetical protein
MDREKAYKDLLPSVEALPEKDRKVPRLPIDAVIQETADLLVFCRDDLPALALFGIDDSYLEDLEKRMYALIYTESRWRNRKLKGNEKVEEARKLYKKLSSDRKDLTTLYRFIMPERSSWLRDISNGRSQDSMIQSCYELATDGKEHVETLKRYGWTDQRLEQLLAAAQQLSEAKANIPVIDYEIAECRRVRDLFFSYLWLSLSHLRRAGQLAFRENPARARGYASSYNRKKARNT